MDRSSEKYVEKTLNELAERIYTGLKNKKLDNPSMGIDHAENQRIRRMYGFDQYDGSVGFFLCEECLSYIGHACDTLALANKLSELSKIDNSCKLELEKISDNVIEAEKILEKTSIETMLGALIGVIVKIARKEDLQKPGIEDLTLLRIVQKYCEKIDPQQIYLK